MSGGSQTSHLSSRRREEFFKGGLSASPEAAPSALSNGTQSSSKTSAGSTKSSLGAVSSGESQFKTALNSLQINGDSSSEKGGGSNSPTRSGRRDEPPTTATRSRVKELRGYVGFANIPNQVYRKAIKQGFDFTLMVVGQSGLGKSTFINSLFLADVYPSRPTGHCPETLTVEEQLVRLVENGTTLTLTLIDTPGFGDAVDNSKCWEPIIDYVDKKYFEFFTEETKIERAERLPDHRVHCCLYFVSPSGHGLKPLDVEFMRQLHERVNIIPVVAKADTLTPEELAAFKLRIMKEIGDQKIKIYQFPEMEDEEENKEMTSLKGRLPFAVVGSNLVQDNGSGKKVRCRRYPWGVVEVENLEHNDFVALRDLVIRTHMIDLVDVTRSVHYENFRCRQLLSIGGRQPEGVAADKDPFTTIEQEKKDHEMKTKVEREKMEQVFQEKVREKQQKLMQHDQELEQKLEQLKMTLENKKKDLEQKQKEMEEFRQQNPHIIDKYNSNSNISDGSGDSRFGKKKSKGLFS